MHQPPSPIAFLRYPITTCITVLAILGTVQFVSSPASLDRFMSNTGDCVLEPWRLLVPALFHEGVIHLLFNLYWLWFFGTKVEDEFGHVAALAIFLVLATGSMAAELAIFRGGIGLSGVGYGLFGMLWVLSRNDPRFHDTVDHSVVELMFGWLLVCIVLTLADVWHVGNVAHCAGCLLGALLGWAISAHGLGWRLLNSVIFVSVFLLFVAGGTVARPYVTLASDAGSVYALEARAALDADNPERAIGLYRRAVAFDPTDRNWWRDLAAAYQRAGREEEASEANRKADDLMNRHSSSE
jgi:membrane associated rhomboid family serine protease